MGRYDRAITVFSPDGRLLQVEYAREAASKGSPAVGLCSGDCVILGAEKKTVDSLTCGDVEKITQVDDNAMLTYSGLSSDARVLVDSAKLSCASAKYQDDEPITVLRVTRSLSMLEEKFTLSRGRRPFGVLVLVAGWDAVEGKPGLYQIDPNGAYLPFVATAIGNNEQLAKDYLEKNCQRGLAGEKDGVSTVLLALQESFAKRMSAENVEVAICDRAGFRRLSPEQIQAYLDELFGMVQ